LTKRLTQKLIRPRPLSRLPVRPLRERRQHNHLRRGHLPIRTELLQHTDPRTPRHHHVQHDQIRPKRTNRRKRLLTINRLEQIVPIHLQRRPQKPPQRLLVIANQNPRHTNETSAPTQTMKTLTLPTDELATETAVA
jgi:hypothetical protein